MKVLLFIGVLFIGVLCNAQSTSLDLVLERPVEFPEEYGRIHYMKDAGNDKIIIVSYIFENDDHQWIPWIYDTKKDTIYSIGINDNILSTNVNGFFSTYFGSQSPPPYHTKSNLDVFAVRDENIYFSAILQDSTIAYKTYLIESNGLPNGTKILTPIPTNCDTYNGLFYNTPEKLFYFVEPHDCQDNPFRIFSFENDTFIEKTTIPYTYISYYRYFQNKGQFYIAMNDQLISINNQTGQFEYILDSLIQNLTDQKNDGVFFTQLVSKKNEVYALLNTYSLNIIYHPIFGDMNLGTKGVYSSKIWKTDGTKIGTQEFINIELDTSKNLSSRVFVSHDRLYFGGVLKGENSFSIYDITDGQLNKVFTYENQDNNSLLEIGLYNNPFEEIYEDFIQIPISLKNKKDYFPLYHQKNADLISIDSLGNFKTEYKDLSITKPYIENDSSISYYANLADIKSYNNNIYFMSYGTTIQYIINEFNDETKELKRMGSEYKDSIINFGFEYFLQTKDGLFFNNKKIDESGSFGLWRISNCINDHQPTVKAEVLEDNTIRYSISNSESDSYTWLVENATIIEKGYDYIEIQWNSDLEKKLIVYGVNKTSNGICMSASTSIDEKVTSTIQKESPLKMSLFPNPANSKIKIEFPDDCEGKLNIFSINGSILKTVLIKGKVANIDINELISGTYLIIFDGNKNIQSMKLSVVK